MCCSGVQCVAVCCSVLQCVAVCCSVLQCVAVWEDLACVAVGCSEPQRVLRYVVECCDVIFTRNTLSCHEVVRHHRVVQCGAVCCCVLLCVTVCCGVLQ